MKQAHPPRAVEPVVTPYGVSPDTTFYVGDAVTVLRALPAESVHCCVTSPPYWGLGDYDGLPPSVWGGTPSCRHRWDTFPAPSPSRPATRAGETQVEGTAAASRPPEAPATCRRCGAWLGQLGLETNPELYVDHVVEVFRAIRQVLRPDGTIWLNLGDAYCSGTGAKRLPTISRARSVPSSWSSRCQPRRIPHLAGLKTKDLLGLPWRVALALQADGWYLRSDIIWAKTNPTPESVRDRPTRAHEYLFLLSKRERYFYDPLAITEPVTGNAHARGKGTTPKSAAVGSGVRANSGFQAAVVGLVSSRNRRTVWTLPTQPFSGAHLATFPPRLVEPCVRAGTSSAGCCGACGSPWRRRTTSGYRDPANRTTAGPRRLGRRRESAGGGLGLARRAETLGWAPACRCRQRRVPCVVLDPFAGAGTTNLVSQELGRKSIYIDIKEEYAQMALGRCRAERSGAG